MLKSLYIKNYALFTETHVEFPNGLNILTGETGAGKSLLVGALGLIMGKRADSSVVFYPEQKCIVEAEFGDLSNQTLEKLSKLEAFVIEEDALLIRREINPSGKSRAFINDTPASLQLVREVVTRLLDLHGQHENQSLLEADHQLDLLDAFAGQEAQVSDFEDLWGKCKKTLQEIERIEREAEKAQEQKDFLDFQLQELEAAGIEEGEEEALEQEIHLLQNSEEVKEALGFATQALYEDEMSMYNRLSEVLQQFERFGDAQTAFQEQLGLLKDANENLREVSFSFAGMLESVESDPERLAFIEERLALYHSLKLKYKAQDGAELMAILHRLQAQRDAISSLSGNLYALQQTLAQDQKSLITKGLSLENKRIAASKELAQKINSLLGEVGFVDAQLEILVERKVEYGGFLTIDDQAIRPGPKGINHIRFMIRTNPGLPMGPLSQIASGGEISRVMLAIKSALADKSAFPVLIFDEIDTGISGEIAQKVGRVMRSLAQRFQILSITHLPQIAAKGHQHFVIYKDVENGRTFSSVRQLDDDSRIQELAKMLSGDNPPASAMQNARELLV